MPGSDKCHARRLRQDSGAVNGGKVARTKRGREWPDPKLVGYCGLYCGDCLLRRGEVADLARDLRKKLREVKFDRVAAALAGFLKPLQDYDKCYQALGAMVRLRCRRPCTGGDGNPQCRPRLCVQRRGLRGCWECGEFETCPKLAFLKAVHADAHLRNLRRLKRGGVVEFIRGPRDW